MKVIKIGTSPNLRKLAELYASNFQKHSTYYLPASVFEGASCYAFTHKGEMVGGLTFIDKPDFFRIAVQVPYEHRNALPPAKLTKETTGYWYNGPKWGFWWFLVPVLREVVFTRSKYFLYSYSISNRRLAHYYSKGWPIKVYAGKMSTGDYESVEYLEKTGIVLIFIKSIARKVRASWSTIQRSMHG